MKLDIELNRDHITISLLNKHRHLVIDDIGLTSLVIAPHEFRMLLSDECGHEILDSISFYFRLCPAQQHAKIVIALNNRSKLEPISIDNNKVRLISIAVAGVCGKILLVDLVDLKNRFHLSYVKLIRHWVIQDVQLNNSKLEEHLVVFEYFERVQFVKDPEYVLYILRYQCAILVSKFNVYLWSLKNPPKTHY